MRMKRRQTGAVGGNCELGSCKGARLFAAWNSESIPAHLHGLQLSVNRILLQSPTQLDRQTLRVRRQITTRALGRRAGSLGGGVSDRNPMAPKRGTKERAATNGVHPTPSRGTALDLTDGSITVGGRVFMEGCSRSVALRRVSTAVGGNGCDGAAASPEDVQPETTNVDGAILGFRNTHSVDDDDPESDLRILRDRHVVRLARRLRCDRFLAAARCKLWWMTPTWGVGGDGLVNASSSTESGVPAETQFAVFELDGGATHVAAVPIICDGFRCTLSGHVNDCRNTDDSSSDSDDDDSSGRGDGDDGSCILSLVAESNCEHETCDGVDAALVLTCADSPFKAVEAAMALASKAMNGTFRLRSCKSPPPVVDVFGWCTWDAFYHAVTPAGVEAGEFSFILANRFWQSFGNRRQSYLAIRLTSCFVQLLQGLERWRTADVPRGSSSSTTGGNQWRPTRSSRSALTTSRTTRPPSRISSTSRT